MTTEPTEPTGTGRPFAFLAGIQAELLAEVLAPFGPDVRAMVLGFQRSQIAPMLRELSPVDRAALMLALAQRKTASAEEIRSTEELISARMRSLFDEAERAYGGCATIAAALHGVDDPLLDEALSVLDAADPALAGKLRLHIQILEDDL